MSNNEMPEDILDYDSMQEMVRQNMEKREANEALARNVLNNALRAFGLKSLCEITKCRIRHNLKRQGGLVQRKDGFYRFNPHLAKCRECDSYEKCPEGRITRQIHDLKVIAETYNIFKEGCEVTPKKSGAAKMYEAAEDILGLLDTIEGYPETMRYEFAGRADTPEEEIPDDIDGFIPHKANELVEYIKKRDKAIELFRYEFGQDIYFDFGNIFIAMRAFAYGMLDYTRLNGGPKSNEKPETAKALNAACNFYEGVVLELGMQGKVDLKGYLSAVLEAFEPGERPSTLNQRVKRWMADHF